MIDRLKDVGQTAITTGEKALRLIWDLVAVASDRIREATEQPAASPPPYRPPAPDTPAAPKPAAAKPRPKPKAAKAKRKGKRPDQMIRVLELLAAGGGGWMSAKELSDAGEGIGAPILPGNVRKVIRARGKDLIETRPRSGSRRGALEYRITAAGREKLKK